MRLKCGFGQESRVPHAVFVPKELNEFWPKAAWLHYFLRGIVLGLLSKVESSPQKFWYRRNLTHSTTKWHGSPFYDWLYSGFSWESRVRKADSDTKETWRILARSSLAVLLSTCDYNIALTKSREFRTHFLISKELDAFWPETAWLSYFPRMIMASSRVESFLYRFRYRRKPTHFGLQRLGSLTFYEWLYSGFSWESKVQKTNSYSQETLCILARSVLALLLSTGDCNMAWAKSREFPTQFIISKEPNPF